jgi:GDPmannose 4,6-dehydratase
MHSSKTALITGIAGQDGSLLARLLVDKGYAVHGMLRWDSYPDPLDGMKRLDALDLVSNEITLHMGDVTDAGNVISLIDQVRPDEIYNLAALSQVKVSFDTPASALEINTKGTLNILEAVRILKMQNHVRIYQASSSEMFGQSPAPQNEETKFEPCSPYGVAKLASYWLARTYRDSYGMHVSNGILFNHESPMRGEDFVTAKIARAVVEIEQGRQECLSLGNLDSLRDWGHARDYVQGMWLMLQQENPGDYVLATGEAHSVREFTERAFAHTGVSIIWKGSGLEETGICSRTEKIMVRVDTKLFRPKEVYHLLGDAAKARAALGWKPETEFDALVTEMVNAARGIGQQGQEIWRMVS